MAWEISISAEGWSDIALALESESMDFLVNAVATHEWTEKFKNGDRGSFKAWDKFQKKRRAYHHHFSNHDNMLDRCLELIEHHNTCENGGNGFWIDCNGDYTVHLTD